MTRKKQRLYNKARRTDNPSDWKKFKELRKYVKKQLTTAHNDYVLDLLSAPDESRSNNINQCQPSVSGPTLNLRNLMMLV